MNLVHTCNVSAHRIIRKNKESILLDEVTPASYTTDPVAAAEACYIFCTIICKSVVKKKKNHYAVLINCDITLHL